MQRANEKLGPGVKFVAVEPHAERPGVRCFVLHRKDGSSENFSYRKCLNALLGREWCVFASCWPLRFAELDSPIKCKQSNVISCFILGLVPRLRPRLMQMVFNDRGSNLPKLVRLQQLVRPALRTCTAALPPSRMRATKYKGHLPPGCRHGSHVSCLRSPSA